MKGLSLVTSALRDSNFRFNGDIEAYIKFLNNHPRRTDYYEFLNLGLSRSEKATFS